MVPEGYVLEDASQKNDEIEVLNAGESVELRSVYLPNDIKNVENNGDRVSNSKTPKTGDKANLKIISICVLVSLVIVVGGLIAKKRKCIFVIFGILLFGSCFLMKQQETFAKDNDKDIHVETKVNIENKEKLIQGNVRYKNIMLSEVILDDFKADDKYFEADIDAVITFTVNAKNADKVNLCKGTGEVLAEMHDDGKNGDTIAGDGIYTYELKVNYSKSKVDFFAKSGDVCSNKDQVSFVEAFTSDTLDLIEEIYKEFDRVNSEYCESNGCMSISHRENALDDIEKYVCTLKVSKKIKEYTKSDSSIGIELWNGMLILYNPQIDGMLSGGNDTNITIYTFQPEADWEDNETRIESYIDFPDGIKKHSELLPTAAKQIANEYSNCSYSEQWSTKNKDISLEDIQKIGKNQIVLIEGHGSWVENIQSGTINTNIKINREELDCQSSKVNLELCDALSSKELLATDSQVVAITGKYIEHHCKDMDNTYIYLLQCHSGQGEHPLAESFIKKGAAAVIGNNESVMALYSSTMAYTTTKLLAECNPKTDECYTLGEALEKAKDLYGKNDGKYRKYLDEQKYDSGEFSKKAEPILFGDENYRLEVKKSEANCLKGYVYESDDDGNIQIRNPIVGAKIQLIANDGSDLLNSECKTDDTGYYKIDVPKSGSYTLKITKEGYADYVKNDLKIEGTVEQNWGLIKLGGICRIGGTTYNTLQEAVENSRPNDTIYIHGDEIINNDGVLNIEDGVLLYSTISWPAQAMGIWNKNIVNINTEKKCFYKLSHGVWNYGGTCNYNKDKEGDIFVDVRAPIYVI